MITAQKPRPLTQHSLIIIWDSDNNHLGALLPAFHNLQPEPESPESRLAGAIVFPSDISNAIFNFICKLPQAECLNV